MNPQIKTSLQRLKDTISEIECRDSSHWNSSLGTNHLNAYAEQLVNDAKTAAAHLKAYGKK